MTLKGKKNHYNIKLLRGYGVPIYLKDNHVVLKDGIDILTNQSEKEEWFVTQIPYEKIVISGKGYVSTEAIKLLAEKNINVMLLDSYGNLIANMNNVMSSSTATNYRMGQYDTFRDPVKRLYLQKQLLTAKLDSQIQFFNSLNEPELEEGIEKLTEYKNQIENQTDGRGLLVLESRSGYLYFRNYAKLFHPRYGFDSRHGGGLVMSNRYASDPINALLNYGYSVLAGEIAKFANGVGLDPYFGFYHKMHTSFHALVYDLIEPLRWLVEYSVYKFASPTNHHGIRGKEYAWTREGNIVLDSYLISRFLEMLSRKFDSERLYYSRHGLRRVDGLAMCQEITTAKIAVQNLAEYCIGKGKSYSIIA